MGSSGSPTGPAPRSVPPGHSLRRSWATHAYEAGLDLLSISRQLRHRRTSMTKGYVDSLTPWRDNAGESLREEADDGR
ncbi:MAG: tyrosine-type recombinase/integrase [Acidimicrobiales bacterium]